MCRSNTKIYAEYGRSVPGFVIGTTNTSDTERDKDRQFDINEPQSLSNFRNY